MFTCNHCPYVKAVIKDLIKDCNNLKNVGLNTIAIMSNDTKNYPEDHLIIWLNLQKRIIESIEYVIDETQEIAKKYKAVCTPDFFVYNKNLESVQRKI